MHSDDKPHDCDQCDRTFSRKHNLYLHKINVHQETKPKIIDCPPKETAKTPVDDRPVEFVACPEEYISEAILTKREGDVSSFECGICHKIYTRRDNLKTHIKIFHLAKALKKFYCKLCSDFFPTADELKSHQEQHLKYNCEFCDKMFNVSDC
jgi:KRAB domain-containing zinc finger protein